MFMVVPSWDVRAEMPEVGPGDSVLATPHYLALTVSDDDLEAVLRSVRRSGYSKVSFERTQTFGFDSTQTTDTSVVPETDSPAVRPPGNPE